MGTGAACLLCLESLGHGQMEISENWLQPGRPRAKEAHGEREAGGAQPAGERITIKKKMFALPVLQNG